MRPIITKIWAACLLLLILVLDTCRASPEPEPEAEADPSLGLLGRVIEAVLTSSDGAQSDAGGGHGHHGKEPVVSSGYGVPVSYDAPSNSYGPPSTGYGAPIDSYGAPVGGCACRRSFSLIAGLLGGPSSGAKPEEEGCVCDGYAAPVDSYGAPVSGYGAPVDSYGAPSYEAPVPSYEAPLSSYGAPSYGTPVSECLCRRFFLGGGSSSHKENNGHKGCDCGVGYNAPVSGYGAPCIKRTFHTGESGGHGGGHGGHKGEETVIVTCGGYGAPSYNAPVSGYGAPSYEAPVSGYGAPSYEAPLPSYSSPGYDHQQVESSQAVSHHEPFHEVPTPHIPSSQLHPEVHHEVHHPHPHVELIHHGSAHQTEPHVTLSHDHQTIFTGHGDLSPDFARGHPEVHEVPHHDHLVVDNDLAVHESHPDPVSLCRTRWPLCLRSSATLWRRRSASPSLRMSAPPPLKRCVTPMRSRSVTIFSLTTFM